MQTFKKIAAEGGGFKTICIFIILILCILFIFLNTEFDNVTYLIDIQQRIHFLSKTRSQEQHLITEILMKNSIQKQIKAHNSLLALKKLFSTKSIIFYKHQAKNFDAVTKTSEYLYILCLSTPQLLFKKYKGV